MPKHETHPVEKAALATAKMLQHLDPGQMAELRRIRTASSGAPGFWRLAARQPETIGRQQETWMAIIRILAILTPKGDAAKRPPLHNAKRRLGEVLCDGGDPGWPHSNPLRPVLSERRLAQLMAAREHQREVLLERAARAIYRTVQSASGVNVVDIAWTLLDHDSGRIGRRLAEPYYRRLDGADRDHQTLQEGANE